MGVKSENKTDIKISCIINIRKDSTFIDIPTKSFLSAISFQEHLVSNAKYTKYFLRSLPWLLHVLTDNTNSRGNVSLVTIG